MPYTILMKPSLMPLQREFWQTMGGVKRALDWQECGTEKRENFLVCEVKNGKLFSFETGKPVEATQGIFTDEAWQEFCDAVKAVAPD